MTKWDDNDFPKADNPQDVGWFVSYWRIEKCHTGCQDGYTLRSTQFDHLPLSATKGEAIALFNKYVIQKRAGGDRTGIKGLVLFLSKIEMVSEILDHSGNLK